MKIDDKIAINAFKQDKESHIKINNDICKEQCREKYCLYVCPADLYSYNEEVDEVQVEFSGCLECGTCMVACKYRAIKWNYPTGGYGIQYRYG